MATFTKAIGVEKIKTIGKHKDASMPGLYLMISKNKNGLVKSFHYRARTPDKSTPVFITIGKRPVTSLAKAREIAGQLKALRDSGATSFELRRAVTGELGQPLIIGPTLYDAFQQFCASKWNDYKNGPQEKISRCHNHWINTLGKIDLRDLTRQDLIKHLSPYADRKKLFEDMRNDISQVIKYVMVHEPELWRASPMLSLDDWKKIVEIDKSNIQRHHAAAHYSALPELWRQLDTLTPTLPVLALRFLILTGARTGEVIGHRRSNAKKVDGSNLQIIKEPLQWADIDFENKLWNVSLAAMKTGRRHTVPLSREALAILEQAKSLGAGKYCFYAQRDRFNAPRNNYVADVLDRHLKFVCECSIDDDGGLEHRAPTAHGMRSTFKGWTLAELIPDHLSEKALAHSEKDKVRKAYARDNLLQQRAAVMQLWSEFLHGRRPAPNPEKILSDKLGI